MTKLRVMSGGADPSDPPQWDPRKPPDWIAQETDLRKDVVEWPLRSFTIHRMGAHGAWRGSPADGWCPDRGGRKHNPDPKVEAVLRAGDYPCKHYGTDLSAPQGSPVYAPHDGWILYAGPATKPPFVGYGPGAILLAHHDTQDSLWQRTKQTVRDLDVWDFAEGMVSLRYSLLGHVLPLEKHLLDLNPNDGAEIPLADDVWDSTKTKPPKSHWRRFPDGTVAMMSGADGHDQKRWVNAGDHIANVGAPNHVHWEIRRAPLADKSGRMDPIAIMTDFYGKALPDGTEAAEPAPAPASSGNGGILALLALFLLSDKKRKRRRR